MVAGGGVSVVSSGSAVMLSRSRELVIDAGSRVFVDCEFHMHNLSMFDNPIVWEKRQLAGGEKTVLNIMGVVQQPFATTRRYDIVLLAQPPRYRLRLKIKGRHGWVGAQYCDQYVSLSVRLSVCPQS